MKKVNHYDFVILAPHIDDEFIGVGELILNSLNKKFKIIYFSSSTYNFRKNNIIFERKNQNEREDEIKNIFKFLNLNQDNIKFLRINNYGLFNKIQFKKTYDYLSRFFKENNVKKVFVPAYEGGNLEHDLVNFMLFLLVKKGVVKQKLCIEFPEYTSYISFFDIKKFKRFVFGTPFKHQLKKKEIKVVKNKKLKKKREILKFFKSQNPKELIKNQGYRDIYYPFQIHNYQKMPYNKFSLNNLIGLFNKRYKIYNGDIEFKEFKEFTKDVESDLD